MLRESLANTIRPTSLFKEGHDRIPQAWKCARVIFNPNIFESLLLNGGVNIQAGASALLIGRLNGHLFWSTASTGTSYMQLHVWSSNRPTTQCALGCPWMFSERQGCALLNLSLDFSLLVGTHENTVDFILPDRVQYTRVNSPRNRFCSQVSSMKAVCAVGIN